MNPARTITPRSLSHEGGENILKAAENVIGFYQNP
jgi:hypothetical protein